MRWQGTVGVYRSDALAEYQEARLRVYLFESDVADEAASYAFNVEQAQIAIGNGGLRGQGLFQGTQTRSDLVPQQQTDFIFTVAGEELGLRGASLLLGLFALLLFSRLANGPARLDTVRTDDVHRDLRHAAVPDVPVGRHDHGG